MKVQKKRELKNLKFRNRGMSRTNRLGGRINEAIKIDVLVEGL
jgi:hypothetical protein